MVMQEVNHQLFTETVLDEVLISMEDESEEQAEKILAELDLTDFKSIRIHWKLVDDRTIFKMDNIRTTVQNDDC